MTRLPLAAAVSFSLLAGCGRDSGTPDIRMKDDEAATLKWKCPLCEQWHTGLPMAYGPMLPDLCLQIPESDRFDRMQIDGDFCVVDGKHFFVRGRLEIRVVDAGGTFAWDVWVSLSEKNFRRTIDLLNIDGRESEEPYFGWLSSSLHLYPETINLKTLVHTREVGQVPFIELEPTNHPLSREQREGITMERIREIAAAILHPEKSP